MRSSPSHTGDPCRLLRSTQDGYDQIAAQYATVNAAMPPEVLASARRFLQLVGSRAHLLDLGCGPGRDMAWFESQGATVAGTDLSRRMLDLARPRVRGHLVQMDLGRLGFPSICFHGVWCNASLLHLPKRQAALALSEIGRILVPGGILFLAIQEGTEEAWETSPYGTIERFFARYRQAEMARLLSRSGFTVLETTANRTGSRYWLHFLARAATSTAGRRSDGQS